jgi:hypothetical protein
VDAAGGELDADGGLGLEAELVAREAREQVGLADAGVADEHHLEEVVVVVVRPVRHPPLSLWKKLGLRWDVRGAEVSSVGERRRSEREEAEGGREESGWNEWEGRWRARGGREGRRRVRGFSPPFASSFGFVRSSCASRAHARRGEPVRAPGRGLRPKRPCFAFGPLSVAGEAVLALG